MREREWREHGLRDDTHAFTKSGAISFRRPKDIVRAPLAGLAEWAIRPRLLGGDYGGETGSPPQCKAIALHFTDELMPFAQMITVNGDDAEVIENVP